MKRIINSNKIPKYCSSYMIGNISGNYILMLFSIVHMNEYDSDYFEVLLKGGDYCLISISSPKYIYYTRKLNNDEKDELVKILVNNNNEIWNKLIEGFEIECDDFCGGDKKLCKGYLSRKILNNIPNYKLLPN